MEAKFSPKVKEIITYSREEALRLSHAYIGLEHLMLGIIRDGDGLALRTLSSLNVDVPNLKKSVEQAIFDKATKQALNANTLPLTKQAERALKLTVLEAKVLKNEIVASEHLLLAILKNKNNLITQIMERVYQIDYHAFKEELQMITQELQGDLPTDAADDDLYEEGLSLIHI